MVMPKTRTSCASAEPSAPSSCSTRFSRNTALRWRSVIGSRPLSAIDIFAGGIDRLRAALGLLPIVLKRPAALMLRLVDLAMGVQPRQRIVADRAQGDDLVAGIQA
jgi:hypothetical protein